MSIINRVVQKKRQYHKMDEKEEEDERVVTRVDQLAEEFMQTTDAGLVKKLSKDMSPS